MYVLWNKPKRLQTILYKLQLPLLQARKHIAIARNNLEIAQVSLSGDRMSKEKMNDVKNLSAELLYWNEIETAILRQRAKVNWLKFGDDNSSFIHAVVKSKQDSSNLNCLIREDESSMSSHADIEDEVLSFYGGLMGSKEEKKLGLTWLL